MPTALGAESAINDYFARRSIVLPEIKLIEVDESVEELITEFETEDLQFVYRVQNNQAENIGVCAVHDYEDEFGLGNYIQWVALDHPFLDKYFGAAIYRYLIVESLSRGMNFRNDFTSINLNSKKQWDRLTGIRLAKVIRPLVEFEPNRFTGYLLITAEQS